MLNQPIAGLRGDVSGLCPFNQHSCIHTLLWLRLPIVFAWCLFLALGVTEQLRHSFIHTAHTGTFRISPIEADKVTCSLEKARRVTLFSQQRRAVSVLSAVLKADWVPQHRTDEDSSRDSLLSGFVRLLSTQRAQHVCCTVSQAETKCPGQSS